MEDKEEMVTLEENGSLSEKLHTTGNQLTIENLDEQFILIPIEVIINAKICRLQQDKGEGN